MTLKYIKLILFISIVGLFLNYIYVPESLMVYNNNLIQPFPIYTETQSLKGEEIEPVIEIDSMYLNENSHQINEEKLIALTFDDGPHKTNTVKLLDILKKYDAKATFFVIGSKAETSPEIVRRMVDEGHQVGCHTYSHAQLTNLSISMLHSEIDKAQSLIYDIAGIKMTSMRPPYGHYNESIKSEVNMPIILWSVDPDDWSVKNSNSVSKHVISKVEDGDIILLHDIYSSSVDAAEAIIVSLKSKGYSFVTTDELIHARQGDILPHKVYKRVR